MKSLVVAGLEDHHVPVKGPVIVRIPLQVLDLPPMLEAPKRGKGFIPNFGQRLIEFHANSPTIVELEELIKWVNRTYRRGTNYTFFETMDITEEEYVPGKKRKVLTLGIGS